MDHVRLQLMTFSSGIGLPCWLNFITPEHRTVYHPASAYKHWYRHCQWHVEMATLDMLPTCHGYSGHRS